MWGRRKRGPADINDGLPISPCNSSALAMALKVGFVSLKKRSKYSVLGDSDGIHPAQASGFSA